MLEITVTAIEWLSNSVYGNPRCRVITPDNEYISMSDANWCYGADRFVGKSVKITLTRAGRIRHMEFTDE